MLTVFLCRFTFMSRPFTRQLVQLRLVYGDSYSVYVKIYQDPWMGRWYIR